MNNNLLNEYKTPHVPLAAYLRLKGVQIAEVQHDGKRGVFVFRNVNRELIIEFNNGAAHVEPNEFAEKMSQLTQTAKRVVSESGGY